MPVRKRLRVHGTLGGVERPRRVVRFARLIHAERPHLLARPSARRLQRQSESDLVATQSGPAAVSTMSIWRRQ